ncbi:AAA domain-containing protein [Escherichia coli]|uniref:AAA domain-containing protein n=3 Tax=Enterobacteriaceae TaxID=543 RepID=UPI000BE6D0C5|nr:AAA domain-containing protein [Escherichia coli]HAY3883690.1 hypothetical protein [Escherichia coli]HBM9925551.1 hypothetical protein [Escherichia coli]HCO3737762.1 hypothetical protein [Escherichia coli]HCO3821682.1 hypothetical protein [Escherichia coli]HEA2895520.1 hypothetical protein [Escherichia coli]
MKESSVHILSAWKDYLTLRGAEKSKISAAQVHEYHQLMLGSENCEEHPDGIVLHIEQEKRNNWCRDFVRYDDNGEITYIEPVNLLFPVLRYIENERGKATVKYSPLFSFPLPKSFFEKKASSLLVPVKNGQLVSAFPFSFQEMTGIRLDELGENRHMMSIVSALTGYQYDTFLDAFNALQEWLIRQGNPVYSGLETAFNAFVAPLHNNDYNLRREVEEFSWLLNNQPGNFPLLEQYLNGVHNNSESQACYDVVTGGLFEPHYSLGHGQMAAIQAMNQDERLIAVQGAPGTGKTTLFKSLIAQQVVARALAVADGKDQNLGMLVTSTAIKAVENIIDDLKNDPVTRELDWLWFHSGSNEQIQHELSRLERLLIRWRRERYDENQQRDFLAVLRVNQALLNSRYLAYLNEKAAVLQSVEECDLDTLDTEELLARFMEKLSPLHEQARRLGIDVSVHHPEDLNILNCTLKQKLADIRKINTQRLHAEKRCQTVLATWPSPYNPEQLVRWMESPLRPALQQYYQDYPRRGVKCYFVHFLGSRYSKRLQQMRFAAPDDFDYFGLSSLSHRQLAALADAGEILSHQEETLTLLKVFLDAGTGEPREDDILGFLADVEHLQDQWKRVVQAQQVMTRYRQDYPEDNWCDILRKRFVKQHREMFEAAIGYLWQEQLKRKDLLEEVLNHWRSLISQRRCAGYYRWLENPDEFYCSLSLVYPVMATTLVSAWKVAGYRTLNELRGYKPWHIALCDEAGMISPESLVPLLSRSEKAMIVGDPLQIEPIRNFSENLQTQLRARHFSGDNALYERVSPVSVTAWHRAAGTLSGCGEETGNGIILDEHRRCQKPIADLFILLAGYRGVYVKTAAPSERIVRAFEKSGGHHLMFYSVEGHKGGLINTNTDEVDAIEQLLNKLEDSGYDLTTDVGIVTPYSNQKSLLLRRFARRMNHRQKNCIGTVHQFQGTGFEVIIYSPVIFHPLDKPNFQNDAPNMLNVVVSRARQQFIVVGNYHRLRQAGGYLKRLADIVAASFLLEQGSQHPDFSRLSQTPRLQRYYRDCEHIAAFSALVSRSEREVIIITPWIRYGSVHSRRTELEQLAATQQRGGRVKVYYGYCHKRLERVDDNDEILVSDYRERLGKENVIRLTEGTHEKVLMIDGRYIVIGSWNWLSHGYHENCKRSEQFSNAIRHELSAELDDVSLVNALRERLKLDA